MWDAELERTEAELLTSSGRSASECEATFLSACEIARRQSAKSLELRVAIGLAKLWAEQGRGAEVWNLLEPIYKSYTEGFNTRDLTQARQMLDSLH